MEIDAGQLVRLAPTLKAGQRVLLSGTIYTARDAAHKRLTQMMADHEPLPLELKGACLYYAGPTKAPEGLPIGSCGPTTSSRMDPYTPAMLEAGVVGLIGKGERSMDVVKAIQKAGAVYFCAIGGAGALAAKCITSCEVIAFDDLGCESIKKLTFRQFPLTVAVDCGGGNLFASRNEKI